MKNNTKIKRKKSLNVFTLIRNTSLQKKKFAKRDLSQRKIINV